jgi:replication initiation protein RepC
MSVLTTSFGRRPASLAQIAAQVQVSAVRAEAARPGSNAPAAVHKWRLFKTLTEVRRELGVTDRALGVLNALLSFHQETALNLPDQAEGEDPPCDLVVFPSNRSLCQRAHGMAEQTLRRHLAALVEAGLIIRRDSPNGKRYARRWPAGEDSGEAKAGGQGYAQAYGFDLTPLVARAAEFEAMADAAREEARALRLTRERVSLLRRDLAKLIGLGLDEAADGGFEEFRDRFLALCAPGGRGRAPGDLRSLEARLRLLHADVGKALEMHVHSVNPGGNDADSGRHQSSSNHPMSPDLEPLLQEEGAGPAPQTAPQTAAAPPLGLVLEACPDIADYHAGGGKPRSWDELVAAARLLRPLLGVSPDAWRAAAQALGERGAAVALAAILQRSEHSSEAVLRRDPSGGPAAATVHGAPAIRSAGGYLRALTEKARAGAFAPGPVLMALVGQRARERRAAAAAAPPARDR